MIKWIRTSRLSIKSSLSPQVRAIGSAMVLVIYDELKHAMEEKDKA